MNHASESTGKAVPVPAILKAALVVSVLGFIVTIADKSHLTPSEFHASAQSAVASVNPAKMATATRNVSTMPDSAVRGAAPDASAPDTSMHYPALAPAAS